MNRAALLFAILCLTAPAQAETFLLRNGQTLQGQVVRQTRTVVYARIGGRIRALPKTSIRRIFYGNDSEALRKAKEAEGNRKAAEARLKRRKELRAKQAEEKRKAAEARRAEEQRRAEEAKRAEEKPKAEEPKRAEEKPKAEEPKRDEEQREAEEARRAKEQGESEEAKRVKEQRDGEQRIAEESRRAEEKPRAEDAKGGEEQREADEAKRAKERRNAEETQRATEQRNAEEARRNAERRRVEETRRAQEKRKAEEKPRVASGITPGRALASSAFAPGLGQWSSGRKAAGATYAGLAAMSLFVLYDANRVYRNARHDYGELTNPFSTNAIFSGLLGATTTPSDATLADPVNRALYSHQFDQQRAAIDRHFDSVQSAGYVFLGLYTINLVDAYFFHPDRYGGTPSKTTPLGALGWSAIFPGLGQWRSGRRGEGLLFGILFGASAAATARAHGGAKTERQNAEDPLPLGLVASTGSSSSENQSAFPLVGLVYGRQLIEGQSAIRRRDARVRTAAQIAGTVYVWSLVDAFLFHPGRTGSAAAESNPGLQYSGASFGLVPESGRGQSRLYGETRVEFVF